MSSKKPSNVNRTPIQPPSWNPPTIPPDSPVPDIPPPTEPEIPITVEPKFTIEEPVRDVNSSIGEILADIDSHMPAGHIYRDNDKITWGHETSHGIASRLRMKHSRFYGSDGTTHWNGFFIPLPCGHEVFKTNARINCFYLLKNRAIILDEPKTTIQAAARLVPRSLRGNVYNLYMVQQAASWGDTPLYILDEWIAYSNGSAVRADLKIQSRGETVQYMLEFNVYALCMMQAAQSNDERLKTFVKWHLKRTMELWEINKKSGGNLSGAENYWEKVRTSSDAESFRSSARKLLGQDWTKHVLNF